MSEDSEHCYYCEASQERLKLAEALESGRYQQLPPAERNSGLLRDPQDRYNITGVATAELAPTIWVKEPPACGQPIPSNTSWTSSPKRRGTLRASTRTQVRTSPRRWKGPAPAPSTGCPEETACTSWNSLGLHEQNNSTHPDPIEVNAYLLSPDEREAAGIPRDWDRPYPLDLLEFKVAANIIRRFQHPLIGHCTAENPPTRKTTTKTTCD